MKDLCLAYAAAGPMGRAGQVGAPAPGVSRCRAGRDDHGGSPRASFGRGWPMAATAAPAASS